MNSLSVTWNPIYFLSENVDTSTPLGQALFTILSAVAQLERDLIRERVSAWIRNAQANGKKLGQPKATVDRDRILELRAQGQSLRQIAANLGVGYGTVRVRLREAKPLFVQYLRESSHEGWPHAMRPGCRLRPAISKDVQYRVAAQLLPKTRATSPARFSQYSRSLTGKNGLSVAQNKATERPSNREALPVNPQCSCGLLIL